MKIVKAKLVKLITDDGLVSVEDDVEIGKEYLVDLDSMHVCEGYNHELDEIWSRLIIYDAFGGWLPRELIEFVEEN